MPKIATQIPFQALTTAITSHRAVNMIPPGSSGSDKKAKTNFSIDWIVQSNNEPVTRPTLPKDYDREICNALRLPLEHHSPTHHHGLSKAPSPGRPQASHTIAVHQQSELQHHQAESITNHLLASSYDDRSYDRITPETTLTVSNTTPPPPPLHSPPHTSVQPHQRTVQPQPLHVPHQRPAPYRPIPAFQHHAAYPHGGTNASASASTHQSGGVGPIRGGGGGGGPIRSGGSTGGPAPPPAMNDNDLVVAQLQFIAAMSYRQQQHQFASMHQQHHHAPAGLHQMPPGHHPHAGMPPSSLMYAQGHLAPPPQFHNDATAYPLAPWLINRHGRLMARPFSHEFYMHSFRKQKRVRTAFAPLQLLKLEHAFEDNQYVVGSERKQLAKNLNLSETQVKVWFQNRRTKHKRMTQDEGGSNADDTKSNNDPNESESLNDDEVDVEDEDSYEHDDNDDVISVLS